MAELAAAAQRNTRQYPVMFELGHGPPGDVTCVSQLSRAEELCTHNRMETVSAKQNITFNRGAVRQQNIHLLVILLETYAARRQAYVGSGC